MVAKRMKDAIFHRHCRATLILSPNTHDYRRLPNVLTIRVSRRAVCSQHDREAMAIARQPGFTTIFYYVSLVKTL